MAMPIYKNLYKYNIMQRYALLLNKEENSIREILTHLRTKMKISLQVSCRKKSDNPEVK